VTFIGHTGEPRAVVKMFDIPVVTWDLIVDIFWPMDFILCVHRYIYKILPIVDTFP
jgi:hypothetical protein